ncbi:flagellar biosynthetic protein FliO [Halomonas sp. CUBES01]|uniref:Flagellar protein n=1 Tax=Vreelandella gomseomensis TaxID=370766 RepID=A0ABU1GCT3_9GAMM|nr:MULTISPECIES: flagellar biosynthetic protein FliO [Halomonas]MDR5875287.1 flagellar biosynthetic protein FliO [Halomonas gomseomensis]MEC4765850.1 flagellar biosynthetic protein FliO [Halomonas sp. CUBES01]
MSSEAASTSSSSLDALSSGGDSLIGMAMIGKTAAALALVIAIILLCTALLKRLGSAKRAGGHLQMISSTAVGNRERVVIVQVEDTWLVLGVGNGRVTKLHERPAPATASEGEPPLAPSGFAQRFSQALAHNVGKKHADSTSPPPSETDRTS